MKTLLITLTSLVLVATACGSEAVVQTEGSSTTMPALTTTSVAVDGASTPAEVILTWTETGGCAMAGPNCARYEISSNGAVTTYREGATEIAASGRVDPSLVRSWQDVVNATDFDALTARLGPGEMTAAFDGIDFEVVVLTNSVTLSSVDVEFDQSEVFFSATQQLVAVAAEAAPLEPEMR
jgi:hypothetical protein